jgi:hypothetical protein
MKRTVAVLTYYLALAVVSIALFFGTLVLLATRQISSFEGLFLLIGTVSAAILSALTFQLERKPWLVTTFQADNLSTQQIKRSSAFEWNRFFDWTGRAQGA